MFPITLDVATEVVSPKSNDTNKYNLSTLFFFQLYDNNYCLCLDSKMNYRNNVQGNYLF